MRTRDGPFGTWLAVQYAMRLSNAIECIKDHYTVVVIGSGYGGAITASRMARAGQQVCVLERGQEVQPGEYPESEQEVIERMQIDLPLGCRDAHLGPRTGLYDVRINRDISVVVGCGLGGTSLINANVSLRADPQVFADPCWPREVRADRDTLLAQGYSRAEQMLQPLPLPDHIRPAKLSALQKSAASLDGPFYRAPINVTFQAGDNAAGVPQSACTLCGNCVSGCNPGAKNSVLMNYLPDASDHGAEIFTQVAVRRIEKTDGRWLVHYQVLEAGRERFDAPTLFVTADIVVLAAGTLGSTEILLRSQTAGLPLSTLVGQRFSGNGDLVGFSYDDSGEIDGVGGSQCQQAEGGPCITGIIDLRGTRDGQGPDRDLLIEEGTIPGPIAHILPLAFAAAATPGSLLTGDNAADALHRVERELSSLVCGPYHGAVRHTQTLLIMGKDDGAGQMQLMDDQLRISWPSAGPDRAVIGTQLDRVAQAAGGTYLESPLRKLLDGRGAVTVHPLGGCVMGDDAASGVVNHKGQVFAGNTGTEVHEGLYVSDGSIIPRTLGVNPLLTISALTERCCVLMARDRGWQIDYRKSVVRARRQAAPRIGIEFTETMSGHFARGVMDDYQQAAAIGERDGSSFAFTVTIQSDDLLQMIQDERHEARLIGTANAPALSSHPMTATEGRFNLFIADPAHPERRLMRYRMKLSSEEGRRYRLDGFKVLPQGDGLHVWRDTTTLYVTVYQDADPTRQVLGRGILRIRPEDLLRQLTTLHALHAHGPLERIEAVARFGRFFAGTIFDQLRGRQHEALPVPSALRDVTNR